jgi:CheY-like chemotaxis protein
MPPTPSISPSKVLVVEDDHSTREMYRKELSLGGFRVIAVADGLDALRTIDAGDVPDVVVLDLSLPRIDGRDIYSELQTRPETSGIPVVIVTGSDVSDVDAAAFRFLLRKPVDPHALTSIIDRALRQARVSYS